MGLPEQQPQLFTMRAALLYLMLLLVLSCGKEEQQPVPLPSVPDPVSITSIKINGTDTDRFRYLLTNEATIAIQFSKPVKQNTIGPAITLTRDNNNTTDFTTTISDGGKLLTLHAAHLDYLTQYNVNISGSIEAQDGGKLSSPIAKSFATGIDSSRKFPPLTDDQLLDRVQQTTFKYFWDFAHPVSGLIREGSKHADNIVTTGGSGFGLMSIVVAMERGFISRDQGLERVEQTVDFITHKAQKFHGAFSHWLDGTTGAVIPFSQHDDGADIVETALMVQGLLCVRQYFNRPDVAEVTLRNNINTIANGVEWNWFQQNQQDVLYWHWSANYGWAMNVKIEGWNEGLITYVLAASSKNYAISKSVYDNGWARSGAIKNGRTFMGMELPLGPDYGGPLFFEHYSFLGINPIGLSDGYANYQTQSKNHSLINYNFCKSNPNHYYGYSDSVWGLTASNIKGGYTASSPSNDQGFIAPTAALSSMPFTPDESMAALKFFYYVLGDKIFREYGFTDAFSLDIEKNKAPWYADNFLAINQGPIIVMIENFRTGLLWNLFTSCPEVKAGMKKLGFSAPYL